MRWAVWAVLLSACGFQHGGLSTVRDAPDNDVRLDDGPVDGPPDGMPSEGPPQDVEMVIEAEKYDMLVVRGGHSWSAVTDVIGFRGSAAMQPLPDNGTPCVAAVEVSCSELQYSIDIPRDDTYRVYVRIRSTNGGDDSVWYGFDGTARTNDIDPNQVYNQWLWRGDVVNPTVALTKGMHVLSLWYRETGIRVDQVAVSTNATPPP